VRGRKSTDLLELEDVEQRMKPFARRYVGLRSVPVDHVVGTEGRASSFSRDFRPRHDFSRDRLRSLAGAFPDGGFPPIVVVKLGETYFVIDGHHRVALTRRNGGTMIDADVTELVARVPLPPGADMVEVVLRELERVFIEQSGLAEARPGVRVSASRPALYLELLENLQVHGYHLMRRHGRVLDQAEIAADWYDSVYSPPLGAIPRDRLGKDLRDAPAADLFLLLHRHRREQFPSCGCPPLEETVDTALAGKPRTRWIDRLLRR
jgi:hypothetical protein